jgi:uncharacterized protein YciI
MAELELEEFEVVFLRRPAAPTSYDDETLERIQAEHLAYLASLRDAGHIVVNGPVIDQPDESLRGLSFFRTGSLEETRRLAEADPAVRAGRLTVEVMHWWCPSGRMVAAGRPFTLDPDD